MKRHLTIIATAILLSAATAFAQTPDSAKKQTPEVFSPVDVNAEFPGGISKLNNYLMINTKNPNKEQGKVIVTFMVEKDGSLTDIKVLKGLSPKADAEAVRVIKASPKWTPAMQKGVPVRQQYTLPIMFNN